VLDLQRHRLGAQLEQARVLRSRNLGVQSRPLGAGLAPLEAKAQLQARGPAVARLAVDRHAPGVDILIADPLGAVVHHLEVVVAG
jgi:hypothetical protein